MVMVDYVHGGAGRGCARVGWGGGVIGGDDWWWEIQWEMELENIFYIELKVLKFW